MHPRRGTVAAGKALARTRRGDAARLWTEPVSVVNTDQSRRRDTCTLRKDERENNTCVYCDSVFDECRGQN